MKRRPHNPDQGAASTTATLPSPEQLALLAALVGPKDDPDMAAHGAMRLYLRTWSVWRDAAKLPWDSLCVRFGVPDLASENAVAAEFGLEPLRFEPKNPGGDEVRTYLESHALRLKTAKAVRENLRDLFIARAVYRGKERQRGIADFEMFIAEASQKDPDGGQWFSIPRAVLDNLIKWKKQKKRDGGRGSLQNDVE